MKKFSLILMFVGCLIISVSCSGGSNNTPRNNTRTSYSGLSKQEIKAATNTAYVSSEPMKIWINPIEYQLEIDNSVGKGGYIEKRISFDPETYTNTTYNQNANATTMAPNIKFQDADTNLETIPYYAKRAILEIVQEYGLDGFLVTLIDQYTGTLSQTETDQTFTTVDKQGNKQKKKNITKTTTLKTIVTIRGIALKLKYLGPVDKERTDKVRQTPKVIY